MLGKYVEVWDVRVSGGIVIAAIVIAAIAIVIAAVVYVRKRMQKS